MVQVSIEPADPSRTILDTEVRKAWNAMRLVGQAAFVIGVAITSVEGFR